MMKSRGMRWAGEVARMGSAYRVLVEKLEGKRPLGVRTRRWEVILKCILEEQDAGMNWIYLVQCRDGLLWK
jgi:hypothetical protein